MRDLGVEQKQGYAVCGGGWDSGLAGKQVCIADAVLTH